MTALDLKYRPSKFSDVVGNSAVIRLLVERSKKGTLAGRSMMFGGPKGCGKTTLARIVARAIACGDLNDGEPCGVCPSCESVQNDSSMSTDEFDAATQGTVDRIRAILDDLEYGTFDGRPRVVILDEAHRLSKPSQDALLKAVEDRRFVVIMCTTEPHKIGEAIRSRVEEYPVSAPTTEDIVARMRSICERESLEFELSALSTIAAARGNCPRTCIADLGTLSTLGAITDESARQLFRYGNMESLAESLSMLDIDPRAALTKLDDVMAIEGPAWTRDNIVHAIASAIRQSVGAKATFPVPTKFFAARGRAWADLARDLGRIDKPSAADVEACILASCSQIPSFARPPLVQLPYSGYDPMQSAATSPPPADSIPQANPLAAVATRLDKILSNPAPAAVAPAAPAATPSAPQAPAPPALLGSANMFASSAKPAPFVAPAPARPSVQAATKAPVKKSVEIDGVVFSASEELTSLDSKIEVGPASVQAESPAPTAEVQWDKSRTPIPEKEFSRAFISRFKQGS